MRTLTLNELDSVSGGASGRDIACVTINNRCTMISSCLVRPENFSLQRFFQIRHEGLVKS